MTNFTQQFFSRNRARLVEQLGADGPVVVSAHGRLQRSADTTYPFSQSRNFWYLSGVDSPDLILVIDRNSSYIILPPVDSVRELFDGTVTAAEVKRQSGVDEVLDNTTGWKHLREILSEAKHVHLEEVGGLYNQAHAMFMNPARRSFFAKVKRLAKSAELHDIRPLMATLRCVKHKPELDAIRAATAITADTLNELHATGLQEYSTEYELEAAISLGFRKRGAAGHAYTPIVASGMNATTLHYVDNANAIRAGEMIVVDVGAEVQNYAADVTRTLSRTAPSKRQQAIYDAVYEVQQSAQTMLKPGTMLKDYEESVCHLLGGQLVKLGLSADAKDMVRIRRYYPHATSHFLGLDVHDVGNYNQPLAEGMVLTCEPGLYIPEEGIGVRIEDDILITKTGSDNLTANCSYEVFDI